MSHAQYKLLKRKVLESKLSITEIAKRTGFSDSKVRRIISEKQNVTLKDWYKFCDAVGPDIIIDHETRDFLHAISFLTAKQRQLVILFAKVVSKISC